MTRSTPQSKEIVPKRLSLGKRLLFACVAVALAFAMIEGVLALAGIKPLLFESDPSVGFASNSKLFVEERGSDGQVDLATAKERLEYFNPQRFPRKKTTGTFRIFSMGGSTTYGHPYNDSTSFNGWLREFLNTAAPERKWEAINAGGISYGSTRVAKLMEELAEYEPDLFLIYCGQNEFLEKQIHGKITKNSGFIRGLSIAARKTRSGTILKKAADSLSRRTQSTTILPDLPETMLDNTLGPTAYKREEQNREQVFERYRFNIQRMIAIARAAGARVIFVTPVSNLRDCSPFKSEFRPGLSPVEQARWRDLMKRAHEEYGSGSAPENGLRLIDEAAAIDSSPADWHFARGRFFEKLGRFAEAKASYERALEEDVCPLRAPTAIGKTLASVCAEERIPLIDFKSMVEQASDHGITGSKLFLDHVHLTIEGYRMLALELWKTMDREKIASGTMNQEAIDRATKAVMGRVDRDAQSFALMNLCKTLGWAGKREEAYLAGAKAVSLTPNKVRVLYEAGLAAQLARHRPEAIEHFRRCLELDPAHAEAHCALGVLLEDQGSVPEAVEHFRLALKNGKPANRQRDEYNLKHALQKASASSGAK